MSKLRASYSILKYDTDLDYVIIRDNGASMSVTNDVENVIIDLFLKLQEKTEFSKIRLSKFKVFYFDSSNHVDEIFINDKLEFDGFNILSLRTDAQVEARMTKLKGGNG